jgi:hypothetical protein
MLWHFNTYETEGNFKKFFKEHASFSLTNQGRNFYSWTRWLLPTRMQIFVHKSEAALFALVYIRRSWVWIFKPGYVTTCLDRKVPSWVRHYVPRYGSSYLGTNVHAWAGQFLPAYETCFEKQTFVIRKHLLALIVVVCHRVARFFLSQPTETGKNIPKRPQVFKMITEYTNFS